MRYEYEFDQALSEERSREIKARQERLKAEKRLRGAAPDLLETLQRAYFLLETNKIEDEYFEVLRLRLGDLLPSQIVSEEMMKAAIANTR